MVINHFKRVEEFGFAPEKDGKREWDGTEDGWSGRRSGTLWRESGWGKLLSSRVAK